jgi:membrane protease YdiL (CAAX protease family)
LTNREAMLAPVFLLCVLLVLLSRSLQAKLCLLISVNPALTFSAPALLSCVFFATANHYACLTWRLMVLVLVYTFVPAVCVYRQIKRGQMIPASWTDLAVILMLWLPLEFSAGASLVPRPVQGVLHATAYGIAVTLGVVLFLLTRRWHGMRYAIVLGGVIFGASHLNNAPGPLPNWRYMAVATIAGLIFGSVFLRSTSVFASTAVHAAVNATKYLFF